MQALIQTFMERRSSLWQALWQHLGISVVSLIIAMAIAIPLAIWVVHRPKIAEVLLQITSVLQTIPSLALLGLLIPIVGIGNIPAVIALVIYALLPIFQNTYIGISEIDPSIEEAADAFGMSRMRKLVKVELPIALPVIISGVRTALVMIIGTATLAALIGAGGLGTFILLGIDRNDTPLILIGAVSAALLAIVLSAVIRWLEHARRKQVLTGLGVIAVMLVGWGTYAVVNRPPETITIAGKLGSEPDILINMYRDLIEQDDAHIKVSLKPNFGQTTFLFNALRHQQVDIYPEFSGTVLETLVKSPQKSSDGLSAQATYERAKTALAKQYQLSYLKPMEYNNTYTLAVTSKFKRQYHLNTVSDLSQIQSKLHAGMTLEFIDRDDGLKGIKKAYHLSFPVSSMQPALRYTAIHQNKVNLVDAYSTDSELRQYNLSTLKDDKHVFPTYQGAPLMSAKFAKKHPQVVKSLDRLAGKISEKDMQEMNYLVNVKNQSSASVARNYLIKHDLLKKGAK